MRPHHPLTPQPPLPLPWYLGLVYNQVTPLRVFVRSFLSRKLFSGSLRPAAPALMCLTTILFLCVSQAEALSAAIWPRGEREAIAVRFGLSIPLMWPFRKKIYLVKQVGLKCL